MLRTVLLCLLVVAAARGDDWPQFRGPARTAISKETGLLQSWPKDGPKLLWSIDRLGYGYSAPSVVGGRIYIMGSDGKAEKLFCLDAKDGKVAWSLEIGPVYENPWGNGPRGNVTVDGAQAFALGGQGILIAVDIKARKRLWAVNLPADLGAKRKEYKYPEWGFTESPLVDAEKVYVTPGGPKGTMAALDRKTGKVAWRSKGWTDEIDYVSPMRHTVNGVDMIVQRTAAHVAGVSPKDGAVLWKYAYPVEARITITSPVCTGDRVFVTSAYAAGCDLIGLKRDGGKFTAKSLYDDDARTVMQNHHGGVILLYGNVYGYSDKGRGGWVCMKLDTGKLVWSSPKTPKGSFVYADGRFVLFDEEKGDAVLIEATTKGYSDKGRFPLPCKSKLERPARRPNKNFWTHPVIADGRLYLRDQEQLMCFDIKAK
jgi:outer membrane protein assembly factor BamB